jgi:hypothetical protein
LTVDHIDRDKSNNDVENLRVATHAQQAKNRPLTKGRRFPVVSVDERGVEKKYDSTREASRITGIPQASISRAARNEHMISGVKWKYEHSGRNAPDLEGEIWKDVYEAGIHTTRRMYVSNMGRVKEFVGSGITIKEPRTLPTANGYPKFSINGKVFRLHRVVADLFLEKSPKDAYVEHLDGNRANPKVSNLRWKCR